MIRTLLVDDDPVTLELHRGYLARLDGFVVAAECTGAHAALAAVLDRGPSEPVDLVLLDVTMPGGSGLDLLRALRARAQTIDVIAVTAVRDAETVRRMAALGVFQYLVKPFSFSVFQERLSLYRAHRQQAAVTVGQATQTEIDALLHRSAPTLAVPKGLSAASLDRVAAGLRGLGPQSAREAADALGLSRVAVRRYLEHLVRSGVAVRRARYGTPGRPETEYAWRDGPADR